MLTLFDFLIFNFLKISIKLNQSKINLTRGRIFRQAGNELGTSKERVSL
jgi:hypothetical protein